MAELGEWTLKGGTLSHMTAQKEYGVDWDFIVAGVRAGKLEYREGSAHGNPYYRLLRSQVEAMVVEQFGSAYLLEKQHQTELRKIIKEMKELKARLAVLTQRKAEIEAALSGA